MVMVEAGGQLFRSFRCGLDYAFIPVAATRPRGCGAFIESLGPDPSARPGRQALGRSMSLYRAGLRLALFLPLGVAMALSFVDSAGRFRRCELRFQPDLTARRDPLIEPPSVSPRLQDLRT